MLELPFCNTSPGGHAPPNAIALDSPRAGDLVPEAGCYFTGDFAPKTKKIIVVKCYPSGYYITGDLPPGVRNLGGVPNHRDTAIDIVQRCAVYFKRPHENICVSIVTCFFDTLNYFKGHFITTILVLCYCFSMSSTNTQSAEAKREKRLQRRRERERAHRAPYRSKQKAPKEDTLSEIEPVISSIAQGPAKNTIKID